MSLLADVGTAEALRIGFFYSCKAKPRRKRNLSDLNHTPPTQNQIWKPYRFCSSIASYGGVHIAGMMSVADVRSVGDAEALLAQLDREEVS